MELDDSIDVIMSRIDKYTETERSVVSMNCGREVSRRCLELGEVR